MCSRPVPTINLAKISLDCLKCQQKNTVQKRETQKEKCRRLDSIPAAPRIIKFKAIQICTAQPIEFIHPAVPCICPPCPICPTPSEKLKRILKLAAKVYVVYFMFEAVNTGNFWGNADASASLVQSFSNFILAIIGSPVKYKGSEVGFLQLDKIKYNALLIWDKIMVTILWYSIAIPLKQLSSIATRLDELLFPERKEEPDEDYVIQKTDQEMDEEEVERRRAERRKKFDCN